MFLPILAILAPIAVYCWVVAAINRRARPTLVSGQRDFIGMLLAASGILLVVGPALINHAFTALLAAVPPDQEFEPEVNRLMPIWWSVWGIYFTVLIAGVYLLLLSRRNKTVIYNVDVKVFAQVLAEALQQEGITYAHRGNHLLLTGPLDDETKGELVVDAFAPLSNVSLHWRGVPAQVRLTIERALAQALDEETSSLDSTAANWFLAMTGVLIGMAFLTGMVWLLLTYFPRR